MSLDRRLPVASGDVIGGKYRVERVLGAGGMGVVFAARHLALGERVAIKLLHESRSASGAAVARFLQEGRAAARIRSGHVARVYDVGTLPTGEPYMVMEYLAGRDLGATLREGGPLAVDAAIDALLQAAEALAVAHASGIIHRDLKPSNLFVTRDADGSRVIKVIDFGISKDLHAAAQVDATAHATRSSVVMGSPHFMPPEQMRSARNADARSDIWALGAILYCLLTGKPPFAGDSIAEIYDNMLAGPPKIRDARPEVPAELDLVLRRCLEREPAARYQDVAAFAEAIVSFAPPDARARAARVARIVASGAHVDDESVPPELPDATLRGAEASDTQVERSATAMSTGAPRDASWAEPASESLSATRTGANSPVVDGPRPAASPPSRPWKTLAAIVIAAAFGAVVSFGLRGSREGQEPAGGERAAPLPASKEAAPFAAPTATEAASSGALAASAPSIPATLSASAAPALSESARAAASAPSARTRTRLAASAAPALPASPAAPVTVPSRTARPDPLADPN